MVTNQEIIEIASHASQSIEAVVRVYSGGGSSRIRERVKMSASILAIEPPPERDADETFRELDFEAA